MDIPDRIQAAQLTGRRGQPEFAFRLYIAGAADASVRAVVNVRNLCERHFGGRYRLEIVDILHHTAALAAATGDRIVAVPALVRLRPTPVRRYAGDLAGIDPVLEVLGIRGEKAIQPAP